MPENKFNIDNNVLYHQDLVFLHDQKSGGFDPETGALLSPETPEYKKWLEFQKNEEARENIGPTENAISHLDNFVNQIKNISLKNEFTNDSVQQALLKKQQDFFVKAVVNCLECAARYLSVVKEMDFVYKNKDNLERAEYLSQIKQADETRRRSHNALIDQINIINRFARRSFGELPAEELEKIKLEEAKAQRTFLECQRQSLPTNGLVTDNIDLNDREQIRYWAQVTMPEFEKLKVELLQS